MAIGNLLGGRQGMIIALVFAAIMNFATYWFSDKIVLSMYRAKEIGETDNPKLYSIVKNLSQADGLPMPRLYIVDTPMPNAFATGRNPSHAAVAVTTGIMGLLDNRELGGVLGHELSHVKDRDVLISTLAATIAGAIFILARMAQFGAMFGGMGRDHENRGGVLGLLAVAILAPIAAMIIQLAISRSREYQADYEGARLTGDPLALADSLRKLDAGVRENPVNVNPVTAPLFIVNPLRGQFLSSLFSTHPPMGERIRRLEEMAHGSIVPG
jgi:heat shock protein HtpX